MDRKAIISKLDVGDIFHAGYPNGASCVCLVLSVDDAGICSKRMATQEKIVFDRQTGIEKCSDGEAKAVIDSVEPLPSEIRDLFLGIDRKYGKMGPKEWEEESDLERFKLTEAEKKALLFVESHYASNPLPALTT